MILTVRIQALAKIDSNNYKIDIKNITVITYSVKGLPSSSTMHIVVPGPSVLPLVIDGLLYCSMVSKATVSLMIIKLGSP